MYTSLIYTLKIDYLIWLNTIETCDFQHFNNGVFKIYFLDHNYLSQTFSKWKNKINSFYIHFKIFTHISFLRKEKSSNLTENPFDPFQQYVLKE